MAAGLKLASLACLITMPPEIIDDRQDPRWLNGKRPRIDENGQLGKLGKKGLDTQF